jgi:hypothetical protein
MAVHVPFNVILSACHDSMRGRDEPAAFIHKTTGEVLFVKAGDPVAAVHFPGIALGKLLATITVSASGSRSRSTTARRGGSCGSGARGMGSQPRMEPHLTTLQCLPGGRDIPGELTTDSSGENLSGDEVPFHSSFHSWLWNLHKRRRFLATDFTVRKVLEVLRFP